MRSIGSTTKPLCWVLRFVLFCLWSGLPEYLSYAEAVQQTKATDRWTRRSSTTSSTSVSYRRGVLSMVTLLGKRFPQRGV